MFAHTSTFSGGAITYSASTIADFVSVNDPITGETNGELEFNIEAPSNETSYCYNLSVQQNPTCGSLSINGSICLISIKHIVVKVGEVQALLVQVLRAIAGQPMQILLTHANGTASQGTISAEPSFRGGTGAGYASGFPLLDVSSTATFSYVVDAGTNPDDYGVKVDGTQIYGEEGTVTVTDIGLDLDLDANYDGKVDETDDVLELTQGGIVVANKDNVYTDTDQPAKRKALIIQKPTNYDGNVVINTTSNNIKVFTTAQGGVALLFNGTDNVFGTATPTTLYVEGGQNPSASKCAEIITESIQGKNAILDQVAFTVVWVVDEARGPNSDAIDGTGGPGKGRRSKPNVNEYNGKNAVLGIHVDENSPTRACASIELVGAISPKDLTFGGNVIPVGPSRHGGGANYGTVELGFIWHRKLTSRIYYNGISEPAKYIGS